ncbi:MAG: hypothetical protein GY820_06445 [Gammaproteobacteria bacterium]|nr:hypothetical protein [Gammaproteobacteria bacterium]
MRHADYQDLLGQNVQNVSCIDFGKMQDGPLVEMQDNPANAGHLVTLPSRSHRLRKSQEGVPGPSGQFQYLRDREASLEGKSKQLEADDAGKRLVTQRCQFGALV